MLIPSSGMWYGSQVWTTLYAGAETLKMGIFAGNLDFLFHKNAVSNKKE
jgi:hypothetical protein